MKQSLRWDQHTPRQLKALTNNSFFIISVKHSKFTITCCLYLYNCYKSCKNFTGSTKPGFYTCASRTQGGTRCLPIYGHQCSLTIPAFARKTCVLAKKVAHDEIFRGAVRLVPRYAVTAIYENRQRRIQKRFSVLQIKKQG